MARKQKGLNTRSRDVRAKTRRKADTWDRIKFLILLLLIMGAMIMSSPDLGFLGFGDVLRHYFQTTAGRVLATLFGLEVLRQIHYLISERSAAYHSFWQDRVFGGMERWTQTHFKPWTRYRVGRLIRWSFYLLVLGVILDYFIDEVNGPIQALIEAPRMIVAALPFIFQLMFGFLFVAVQFLGIFWLLSRGGMDVILPEEVTTRFDDVWGQDHVLDLLRENIAFLEKPDEIEEKGGYIPGGILLWGPPGTGKTLMAQATAGETGRPFVFVEPGAFINMFFGIGILKVKSLYRKLRKLSLRHGGVIVFFDEADSLGSRGQMGGTPQGQPGHTVLEQAGFSCNGLSYLSPVSQKMLMDEWIHETQGRDEAEPKRRWTDRLIMGAGMGGGGMGTLQALLTEMNGLTKPRGITNRLRKMFGFRPKPPPKYRILHIMATNMPNALDEAMLRPGRIDRIYKVGFPSKEGRRQTIVGYLDKVEHVLTEEQIDKLATVTPYYSGAKIKDMVNEALILAVRDGREAIEWQDIWKAKALKELGPPEDVDYIQRERHAVAVHEASHAVTAHLLGAHRRIDMVSIEKRASTLGMVRSQGEEERFTQWKSEFETDIMVSLASLAGERMFFEDDNSSGVTGDLSSASRVAAMMEGSWGMGASLTSAYGTRENAGGGPASAISVAMRENREAIEKNLATLYDRVAGLLEEHKDKILELAAVLEERKNISGDEVAEIMGSAPGSRAMREPKGWQAVSDTVAGERQREALLRTGREVAMDSSEEKEED
ncbi:MAG TPA: AAA family ATPase [Acidimicrobiia bacterium]|jgi:ATP-dependent Zn protease|nr:AAA family ATPase [Acidimicrobiia bacterium]